MKWFSIQEKFEDAKGVIQGRDSKKEMYMWCKKYFYIWEKFEDVKGVIRQYNSQRKKKKRPTIMCKTKKTKDWAKWTPQKRGDEIRCSEFSYTIITSETNLDLFWGRS